MRREFFVLFEVGTEIQDPSTAFDPQAWVDNRQPCLLLWTSGGSEQDGGAMICSGNS